MTQDVNFEVCCYFSIGSWCVGSAKRICASALRAVLYFNDEKRSKKNVLFILRLTVSLILRSLPLTTNSTENIAFESLVSLYSAIVLW